MSIEIGKAKHGRKGFTKFKNFYLKSEHDKGGQPGGNNIYRVLPPIKSLARDANYSKYYATHKGFVGTDGKPRWFLCIEDYDRKNKEIRVHCPVCDRWKELTKQLEALQKGGQVNPEKIKEAREAQVDPLRPEKRYYVNVLTANNEIGYLELPIKSHTALKARCDEYDAKGIDLVDVKSVFLNFKKISAYKGDNQALYPVEIWRETVRDAAGNINEAPKVNTLTEDIINRLEAEAPDLGKDMFRSISAAEMSRLVAASGVERQKVVDSIFTTPEEDDDNGAATTSIPGTNATAVGRMEVTDRGLEALMPNLGAIATAQPPVTLPPAQPAVLAAAQPAAQQAPATVAPLNLAPAAAAPAPAPQPANPAQAGTITDAEFDRIFGKQ